MFFHITTIPLPSILLSINLIHFFMSISVTFINYFSRYFLLSPCLLSHPHQHTPSVSFFKHYLNHLIQLYTDIWSHSFVFSLFTHFKPFSQLISYRDFHVLRMSCVLRDYWGSLCIRKKLNYISQAIHKHLRFLQHQTT